MHQLYASSNMQRTNWGDMLFGQTNGALNAGIK